MADTPSDNNASHHALGLTEPSSWSLTFSTESDDTFSQQVVGAFRDIYAEHFSHELWIVNHNLPTEIRALRHTDPWRIMLLLTPWMLARLFSPLRDPDLDLPPGWQAGERTGAGYTVIGPAVKFSVLGQQQTAYLNYHQKLGHYLVQPLVQSMQQYPSPEAVYEAWSEVIRTRDETIRARKLECEWQNEVSRREFFTRFRTGGRDRPEG